MSATLLAASRLPAFTRLVIGRRPDSGELLAGDWLETRGTAVEGCRGALAFREAGCGWRLARPLSCHVRGCPDCERSRATRVVAIYADAAARMQYPALVTVTLRNVPAHDLAGLEAQLEVIREGWAKLQRRAIFRGGRCKSWRSRHQAAWSAHGNRGEWPGHHRVAGGLSSVELTYNAEADTLHVHLHALCDVRWLDQAELSDAWRDLTGSYVVDIRRVRARRLADGQLDREELRAALREVLKYVAKPSEHLADPDRPELLANVLIAMRGRRLIAGFGSMYGLELDPEEEPLEGATVKVPDPFDPFRSYTLPARCPYCEGEALWESPQVVNRLDCRRPPPLRPGEPPPPLAHLPLRNGSGILSALH